MSGTAEGQGKDAAMWREARREARRGLQDDGGGGQTADQGGATTVHATVPSLRQGCRCHPEPPKVIEGKALNLHGTIP
jgi:hypothetical protein